MTKKTLREKVADAKFDVWIYFDLESLIRAKFHYYYKDGDKLFWYTAHRKNELGEWTEFPVENGRIKYFKTVRGCKQNFINRYEHLFA
jgi:hypothetical protein